MGLGTRSQQVLQRTHHVLGYCARFAIESLRLVLLQYLGEDVFHQRLPIMETLQDEMLEAAKAHGTR